MLLTDELGFEMKGQDMREASHMHFTYLFEKSENLEHGGRGYLEDFLAGAPTFSAQDVEICEVPFTSTTVGGVLTGFPRDTFSSLGGLPYDMHESVRSAWGLLIGFYAV